MKKALLLSENGNYRDYNNFGCSPHLLESFIGWLSEQKANIAELNLALYLFNNEVLLRLAILHPHSSYIFQELKLSNLRECRICHTRGFIVKSARTLWSAAAALQIKLVKNSIR